MDYQAMAKDLMDGLSSYTQAKAERLMATRFKGQVFVLTYLLANRNQAHPKDLSDSMMVSTARMAVILRQLDEDGIITRTTDPGDRRQTIVSLTEKGIRLTREYYDETLESLTKMLEYLGPEDAASYIRIRKKILQMNTEGQTK